MPTRQIDRAQPVPLSPLPMQLLRFTHEKGQTRPADFAEISPLSRKGTYNAVQKLVYWELLQRFGQQKNSYDGVTEKERHLLLGQ